MRGRWHFAFLVSCGAGALVAACASDETTLEPPADSGKPDALPSGDAGPEAAPPDAAPCADCEYFPNDCTADAICPNGPFGQGGFDPRSDILVVRGRSEGDVWAAGAMGAVAHFDGAAWTRSELGAPDTQRTLWLRDASELVFGRFTEVFTRGIGGDPDASVSPGGWSQLPYPSLPGGFDPVAQVVRSSWAAPGSNTLWIATSGGAGGLWRLRHTPPSTFEFVEGIGPALCGDLGCNEMLGIYGTSPSTLWAVGGGGAAIRIVDADGEAPKAAAFNTRTTNSLRGVWAAGSADVWAVGASGTIRRYRGDPRLWEVVDGVPTTSTLHGVWGTSASDIWAVGEKGVVIHYDGARWSRVKVAGIGSLRPNFYTVWAPAPGHVWVGGQGVVLSLGGKP